MEQSHLKKFQSIRDFPELVKYLGDELDWPIDTDDFEEELESIKTIFQLDHNDY